MNPLGAIYKVLDVLSDSMEAAVARSEVMEGQLRQASGQIESYKAMALAHISSACTQLEGSFSLSMVVEQVKQLPGYDKIKDQPLAPLLALDGAGDDDMAEVIQALQAYLTPLDLPFGPSSFSAIESLTELPSTLSATPANMTSVLEALEQAGVSEDLQAILRDLDPNSPPQDTGMTALLAQLNEDLPAFEQYMQSEDEVDLPGALSHLWTQMQNSTEAYPEFASALQGSGMEGVIDQLKAAIDENETALQENAFLGVLNILSAVCQQTIPSTSPMYVMSEMVQKLQIIVHWLVSHGLWVPISVHHLQDQGTMPGTAQIPIPPSVFEAHNTPGGSPQATGSASTAGNGTPPGGVSIEHSGLANAANAGSGSSADSPPTTATTNPTSAPPQSLFVTLLAEGLEKLLPSQQQFASAFLDGSALAPIQEALDTMRSSLEGLSLPQQPETLEALIGHLSLVVDPVLKAALEGLEDVLKAVVDLMAEGITLLIDLVAAIRIPDAVMHALDIPMVGSPPTAPNLIFLMLTMPWELVKTLLDTDLETVKAGAQPATS